LLPLRRIEGFLERHEVGVVMLLFAVPAETSPEDIGVAG
jgi:hypothetical protein